MPPIRIRSALRTSPKSKKQQEDPLNLSPKKKVSIGGEQVKSFKKTDEIIVPKRTVSAPAKPVRPKPTLVPFKPSPTGAVPAPAIPLSARPTAPVSVNPIAQTSGANSAKPLLSRTRTKVALAGLGGVAVGYGLGTQGVGGIPEALQFGMSIFG